MSQRKKVGIGVLLGSVVFAAVFAVAANLDVGSDNLGAGSDVVAACTADELQTSFATAYNTTGTPGFKVTTVTVHGVPESCVGQTIAVQLSGAAGAGLGGSTPVIAAEGDNVVTITGDPLASDVIGIHVVISG